MTIEACFPTSLYRSSLARDTLAFNRELLRESYQIAEHDREGRKWSKENYPGGYTSYSSITRVHQMSSTFAELKKKLDRHVAKFARHLEFDLSAHKLEMTTCWINIVPRHTYHGLHLHPLSTVSGTYYVQVPPSSGDLKFEDPRLSKLMASPPRKPGCRRENQSFLRHRPRAGEVVLFESWLRHEVMQNQGARDRVSVSFNYNWF